MTRRPAALALPVNFARNRADGTGIPKYMMRGVRNALLVLALAALAGGCAYTVNTAMFRAPYPPTASLDVYRDKPPDRPYVEIAQIGTYDQGNALGRLVEKAKELGADAIIVLPRRYAGTDYSYLDASQWVTPYYAIEVIAIKYR